jgi:hypothetical protein
MGTFVYCKKYAVKHLTPTMAELFVGNTPRWSRVCHQNGDVGELVTSIQKNSWDCSCSGVTYAKKCSSRKIY